MNNIKKYNSDDMSKLPDLFKELQDIRYGRAKPKHMESPNELRDKIKYRKIKYTNKKFNAIGAIIGILFVILFFSSINSNYIFATTEKQKVAIGQFEENENSINIMETISTNISDVTVKEILTKEIEIPYETKYIETDLLPKDEQNLIQAGQLGFVDRTSILTYENDELIDETIIGEVVKSDAVEEIIEVGTSEFLFNNKVHIGDTMYIIEETPIYESLEDNMEIGNVYQYIDVKILSEKDGWANIEIDDIKGYVDSSKLTSELVTPGIAEKSRIKRIMIEVNPDMNLNTPSGLTKDDFVKVLSGNSSDKNHIFEQNAEVFYEIEQEYNVNGLFLAAIGIHESNWGTSNIASQKKNLFGYGSYDSSAYSSSYEFESYEYGIRLLAKVLSKYYLNEPGTPIFDNETAVGSYYNGPTIAGVNIRYASDTNWSTRVYNIMASLYAKL